MLISQTKVNFSIVFLCVMFSMGIAEMNVLKHIFVTTKDRRILPSSTSVLKQITLSPAACASLCSIQETCCSASYDMKTKHCYLDESCCPKNESSIDAIMLKKTTDSFPNQWLQYGNKCLYFSKEEKTWDEARLTCKYNYGSRLVEVGSSSENDFLKNAATVYGQSYWLGGSDIQNEGTWMWVSSLTQFTFTDWSLTEPSKYEGEDCVRMTHPDLKWGDIYCSRQYRFICEQKVE